LISRDALKNWLPRKDLKPAQKALLVLASRKGPMAVKEIKNTARLHGAPAARKWNISNLLARSGCAVRGADGWELNDEGRRAVAEVLGDARPPIESDRLKAALAKVTNPEAHAFLEEAVNCYGRRLYRAAVVLSWEGALWLLYGHVEKNCLPAFNAEATRRNPKWREAKNIEGFSRMQESDFLDIAEALNVVGKSVKKRLQACLDLRNACGHPNTYQLGENAVAHHIEHLALNVFSHFA
jgi:hypothetical protein